MLTLLFQIRTFCLSTEIETSNLRSEVHEFHETNGSLSHNTLLRDHTISHAPLDIGGRPGAANGRVSRLR